METRGIATSVALLIAVSALGGCAAPRGEKRIALWLSDAPRSLAVEVDPNLPAPEVRTDHTAKDRAARGVGGGVSGALYTIGMGCIAGPVGCAIGAIAAPFVGTVTGVGMALTTHRSVRYHALSTAKGAVELTEAAIVPAEVAARLEEAVLSSGQLGRHALQRPMPGGEDEGSVRVRIAAVYLESRSDPNDDDAEVALVMDADVAINTPFAFAQKRISVEGSRSLAISEWRKDDEKLFREELRNGIDALGAQVVKAIDASPGMAARARRAFQR